MTFIYKADPVRGAVWAELLAQKMPELRFRIWPDVGNPREVRFLAAWQPPDDLVSRFPNLEVLFSTGAGTDQFDFSTIPAALPVVRMVESGITHGMVEYVTLAVLSHTVGYDLEEAFLVEVRRCLSKDPAHFAARNKG